jgi:hypothetical protein
MPALEARLTDSVTSPLFVVGPSRAGTALMRSMLNNHPEIYLTGETHYFDDLRVKLAEVVQAPLSPGQERQCEDYFRALAHRPYGHAGDPGQGWLTTEALRAERARCGEGADAYFEAYCRLNAARSGKARWGEKTPRHVYRIPDILGRYPEARVVCMIRDPRAIAASYRDWKNQGGFDLEHDSGHREALELEEARARSSYHIVIQCMLWRGVANAALGARDRFGPDKVYLQRYEDFVEDPAAAAAALLAWLGLAYDEKLLDVPMHNSSFSNFSQQAGVSKAPVGRWREKLGDAEIAVVQDCCGGLMQRLGYAREPTGLSPARLLPWITLPYAVLSAARANRDRIGNLPAYILRRLRLATGSG